MMRSKSLGVLMLTMGVLSAQVLVEDPVLKTQARRKTAGPPPLERGIQEPPPLPAPESHPKDTPGWRAKRATRRVRRKAVKARPPVKRIWRPRR